jgi:hypothetical protein
MPALDTTPSDTSLTHDLDASGKIPIISGRYRYRYATLTSMVVNGEVPSRFPGRMQGRKNEATGG